MQVLAANPRIKYVTDPFDLYIATTYQLSRLLKFSRGTTLLELSTEQEQALCTYMEDIFAGRLHVNENARFWRRGFDFFSDRSVVKIINGPCLAPTLARRFNAAVILLFRHPIPQSLSCIRNGWPPVSPIFLSNSWFVSSFLDSRLEAKAHDVLRSGSALEKHVLDWCMQNTAYWHQSSRYPEWWMMTYEHFVENTDDVLRAWRDGLALPDLDRMRSVARLPSNSARGLSAAKRLNDIQSENTDQIIGSWRKSVDERQERQVMEIVEAFEIDLYRAGDIRPTIGFRPGLPVASPE